MPGKSTLKVQGQRRTQYERLCPRFLSTALKNARKHGQNSNGQRILFSPTSQNTERQKIAAWMKDWRKWRLRCADDTALIVAAAEI